MGEETPNPQVPLGVWVFWSLVGLGLLIALFRWATGGNTPTYIAPIAACVSALAATYAVYMTTKTFRQARLDRKEELEAKHPRFIFASTMVIVRTLKTGHYPELTLIVQNIREHAAKHFKVEATVFLDPHKTAFTNDDFEPTDYVEKDGTVDFSIALNGIAESDEPYFVRLTLSYIDARTQKTHTQTLWRQFCFPGDDNCNLLPITKAQLDTRYSKYLANSEQITSEQDTVI